MTISEAKELLSFHSCRNTNIDNPKWKNGFLGHLRPFKGELNENNFIEVMECMKVLAQNFENDCIDKNMISDIYTITYLARCWSNESGMLGSNKLLTAEQTDLLNDWIYIMEYALFSLLDSSGEEEAFWAYNEFLENK